MSFHEFDPLVAGENVRRTLGRYTPALRRGVAEQLLRTRIPRWKDALNEKLIEAISNAPLIDRRLRDLDAPARGLLALIDLSRQPCWRAGGLLELLSAFAVDDGMAVIFRLLEAGLLYPELPEAEPHLQSFAAWLGRAGSTNYRVFAPPSITRRAATQPLQLESLAGAVTAVADARETDGLEYPIRLGALWQQVKSAPLRLTQQGDFFKRDYERLTTDPLLAGAAADEIASVPQPGQLLVALGLALGLLEMQAGEMLAAKAPLALEQDLADLLGAVWAEHAHLDAWDPESGWRGLGSPPTPYGSAAVLALALLRQLPADHWAAPEVVAGWLARHHCFWNAAHGLEGNGPSSAPETLTHWTERFLLGVAYQLRLLRAGRGENDRWVVQLSALGRGILGCGPMPELPQFPKTLLVQPNLEIIAYRQGLAPRLIGNLSRFCTWKTIGPACLLQVQPESVYRGLETGLSHEEILARLQQHSIHDLPAAMLHSLQTWSAKRERVTVHGSATLLEFARPADLEDALGRGLAATRLSDRLALVAQEGDIDYRQFRLAGARDYGLPPDQCVAVASDGVTLEIDLARADLLLETEVRRFAEAVPAAEVNGRRVYRLTPASLRRAGEGGVGVRNLEEWFQQRTGTPLTAAARLLLDVSELPPTLVQRLLVLQVPTVLLADGLMQWPVSRRLIQARLGPTALAIEESNLAALEGLLRELGVRMEGEFLCRAALTATASSRPSGRGSSSDRGAVPPPG